MLSTAALACGCAGAPAELPPSLVTDPPPLANDTAAFSDYQLSEEEQKYDCKKLTGKMQMRILQMRGYDTHTKQTSASRAPLQAVTTPIFGGTKEGLDPDGQYRKDRAMLEAYNRRARQQEVQDVRLDAELAQNRRHAATDPPPRRSE